MKLTLWLLNRITQWEEERSGELASALSGLPNHDVKLGRRVEKSKNDVPGVVELIVNESEPSFPGELMHEGRQQRKDGMRSSYDEYFMPIPLKCIGRPGYEAGKPQLTDFWKQLIPPDKHEEFLSILDPDRAGNDCFLPKHVDTYWRGRRPVSGDSDLAKQFSDVRMNTRPDEKIGYYQILQQAKAIHGDNILIGYSQGGLVVQYLAYLDEHFVPKEKRCIRGAISVQAPLRGSTLAMQSRQQDVLDSLVRVLHALWGERLLRVLAVPSQIRAHVDPMLARGHKLTLDEVITTLDLLFNLAKHDKALSDFVRTARKWLSGLHGDTLLAFWDIDSTRMNQAGSVLQAIDANPLLDTYCASVVGGNSQFEPLLHAVIQNKSAGLGAFESLIRGLLSHIVHPSEIIFQTETFDMMPKPLAPPNVPLAELHTDWQSSESPAEWDIRNGVSVPVQATDCVIPSASQLMRPGPTPRPKFLGNYVNLDASHISGAVLEDPGSTDLDHVKEILGKMAEGMGEAAGVAGGG